MEKHAIGFADCINDCSTCSTRIGGNMFHVLRFNLFSRMAHGRWVADSTIF